MMLSGQHPKQVRQCAKRSEILERLRAMTFEERKAIIRRIRAVGMNDAEDLLHEAIVRALENRRKWYPQEIDFPTFLSGTSRSIGHSRREAAMEAEPVDELPSPIDHQAQMEASIALSKVRYFFRSHPEHLHALEIFELKMNERYTGPEIQGRLGITPKEYAAEYKWILRSLQREGYRR